MRKSLLLLAAVGMAVAAVCGTPAMASAQGRTQAATDPFESRRQYAAWQERVRREQEAARQRANTVYVIPQQPLYPYGYGNGYGYGNVPYGYGGYPNGFNQPLDQRDGQYVLVPGQYQIVYGQRVYIPPHYEFVPRDRIRQIEAARRANGERRD